LARSVGRGILLHRGYRASGRQPVTEIEEYPAPGVAMPTLFYICLGAVALLLLLFLGWRFASRRSSLPCPAWLGWMVELDNPFARSNRASNIVNRLDLQPGMKVVDVGCGPGRLTIPLARAVGPQGEVLAMDIQPGMLQRVQAKAQAANLNNIQYLQAGAGEGKLERSHYDRAVLVTVLGEIPDREAALREIVDALEPGGILSVTETVFDPHYQTRKTVLQLARTAGLRQKDCSGNWLAFTLNLEKPQDA
jgi:SAM-dependent methyltransferase